MDKYALFIDAYMSFSRGDLKRIRYRKSTRHISFVVRVSGRKCKLFCRGSKIFFKALDILNKMVYN